MYREKITIERNIKVPKPRVSLSTKISFQPPAKCIRTAALSKRPVSAAGCDHQSRAPVGFIFMRFAGLLSMKAPLHSHPNGCRVPKLTLEKSKGMSPPIHQRAVLDPKHSYT